MHTEITNALFGYKALRLYIAKSVEAVDMYVMGSASSCSALATGAKMGFCNQGL